tara:strand:+ start:420 stop:668 length:249 start_codon:yes stop_codon:yes gene_type:complete
LSHNSIVQDRYLNLIGVICPLNFIRCKLALEKLKANDLLYVDLDKGEPEDMVISGLRESGHIVNIISEQASCLKLEIICKGE